MEKDSETLLANINIKKIKRKYISNIFSEKLKGNLTKNIMNYLTIENIFSFSKTCIFIYNNFIDYENIKIKKLEEKGKNSLLEVNIKNNKKGFCFLCEIPWTYNLNLTKAIIINNNFFDDKENKIKILDSNNKIQEIELNEKFKFIDKDYNITIIELEEDNNNLNNYFTLKENIFEYDDENNGITIYILYYSENKQINISFGELKETEDLKKFSFFNEINTFPIGSPIFNFKDKTIIGYYRGYNSEKNYNEGQYFRYPINNFILQKNISTGILKGIRRKRLFKLIKKFYDNNDKKYNILLKDEYDIKDNEYGDFLATINVIDDCPYKGGRFEFEFNFSHDFPFKPPKINLNNKIYHPNFRDSGGSIIIYFCPYGPVLYPCILNKLTSKWTPDIEIPEILDLIYSLLINPSIDPDDIVNEDCAQLFKNDKNKYEKIAKEWTEKYSF